MQDSIDCLEKKDTKVIEIDTDNFPDSNAPKRVNLDNMDSDTI